MASCLFFDFEAVLRGDEKYYISGHVEKQNWQNESFRHESDAAWAHVRGQLEVVGDWSCMVTIDEPERRVIRVMESEGMIFRFDVRASAVKDCM